MPLSPADGHNVAFSKPPIGKRGYNEDEVDQFLDLVEEALAQLQDENYELQKQLEDGSGSTQAAGAAPAVDEAAVRKSAVSELQAESDKKLADAKAEANKSNDEASKAKPAKPAAAPSATDNTAEIKAAQDETAKVRQELAAAKKELEAAKKENSTLKASKSSSAAAPAAAAATGAAAGAAAGTTGAATPETHMQAARILGMAQDMADRLSNEARAESDSMLTEAREAA